MDDNLIKRVHALPPELFNQIRDEVLDPPTSKVITIDASFNYPVQMRINRSHREAFCKKYFQNAILKFDSVRILSKFCILLEALDESCIETIRCFTIPYKEETRVQDWETMLQFTFDLRFQDLPFVSGAWEENGGSSGFFWVCRHKDVEVEEFMRKL